MAVARSGTSAWVLVLVGGALAGGVVLQYAAFVRDQPAVVLPQVARLAALAGTGAACVVVAGGMVLVTLGAYAAGRRRAGGPGPAIRRVLGAQAWVAVLILVHEGLVFTHYLAPADWWAEGELLWLAALLTATLAPAGWLWGLWQAADPPAESARPSGPWVACVAAALFHAALYSILSLLQYEALHVPHGDSGMYEEHLWNLLHGKGFRSQLDDGRLFFGEHLQVVHVLLVPIYVLCPTLPTLNACQSVALGSGALAVWWMARRNDLGARVAGTLGLAYLLYFPMQYLNLEASWKTFRPTSFGTVALLFALGALEAHRYRLMMGLFAIALLVQEEYAIAVGTLGLYLAVRRQRGALGRREIALGLGIAVFAAAYLAGVLGWLIPYFRGGAPHYTPYFASLGKTPAEILRTVCTHPAQILGRVSEPGDVRFVVLMLLPVGFLPLASPLRLATALPVFGYLLLGEREGMNQPWFHFHAPLVALVWWATVGGSANLRSVTNAAGTARLVLMLALASGFWLGRGPFSWRFYDPAEGVPRQVGANGPLFEPRGSYFGEVYVATARSRSFATAFAAIRPDERVAATDYVRSRFTHHAAAHDYPTLRGHVTIDDIDVIVLDKAEGWWGRGPTNPDRRLLECMADPDCRAGTEVIVRDRPFVVVLHDDYFLVVRRVEKAGDESSRTRREVADEANR